MDGKYSFSLSETALLDSKLVNNQELTHQQVVEFKQLSDDDKIYGQVLNYLSMRPRSKWEIETYLKHKKASPALSNNILNKLSINKMLDDEAFARSWINDRLLLRSTSRRKLILELKQKHVDEQIIQNALEGVGQEQEQTNLIAIVATKRKQSRYQDDLKLMQYLARQGFNYGDIKAVLQNESF